MSLVPLGRHVCLCFLLLFCVAWRGVEVTVTSDSPLNQCYPPNIKFPLQSPLGHQPARIQQASSCFDRETILARISVQSFAFLIVYEFCFTFCTGTVSDHYRSDVSVSARSCLAKSTGKVCTSQASEFLSSTGGGSPSPHNALEALFRCR